MEFLIHVFFFFFFLYYNISGSLFRKTFVKCFVLFPKSYFKATALTYITSKMKAFPLLCYSPDFWHLYFWLYKEVSLISACFSALIVLTVDLFNADLQQLWTCSIHKSESRSFADYLFLILWLSAKWGYYDW